MSEQGTRQRFPELAKQPVELERAVASYWDRAGIFARTQAAEVESSRPHFVFYEGPPTANGNPGVHHVITRLAKDTICRYKSMDGHFVLRKAGWDTHGLPVELEVQKRLGLKTKADIEAYGVEAFNAKCRESVFSYEKEWRQLTRRIGYWLDLEHPYITCDDDYVESVWWLLRQLWDADLIYKGHKVLPYNPRLGTVYSSHEVAQGYADVEDPSVTVRFPLDGEDGSLLVWTTTPWTLLSNVAVAVHPELTYVKLRLADTDAAEAESVILAEDRVEAVLAGRERYELWRMKGAEMAGWRYRRLYDFAAAPEGKRIAEVICADFVSAEDGTGLVHMAPAYGADDYEAGRERNLAFIDLVGPDGKVRPEAAPFAGLDFKAADPPIMADLKQRGLLFARATVTHSYPHCWRDKGPLIYYAQPAWFIRTTALKERFLSANAAVRWVPPEMGEKRFGDWLKGNVDWALSRDRYWGTPLPIWVSEDGERAVCVGSFEELRKLSMEPLPERIDPHKPMVDAIALRHPETGETLRRVPDVIDAWFDSGSMPFAQWHYPFENKERFEGQYPADFICEAVDQSRGWFYSLLAIGVFMKGQVPYKSVLVSGHVVDVQGKKMSKSLGNSVDPFAVLDADGADALRLYMATTSPLWTALKFDPAGPREMNSKLLGTLRNTYAFLALYANLDGWTPGCAAPEFSLMDRWIRSRFETLVAETRASLDALDLTKAAKGIVAFVVEELSNWYVRRSRRRFWKGEMTADKAGAYETLYGVLDGVSRLVAPFVPFLPEAVYRGLRGLDLDADDAGSVHLDRFPVADASRRDVALEAAMGAVLQVVGLGRTLRNQSGLKTRQPLASFEVAGGGDAVRAALADPALRELVLDELNVKAVGLLDDAGDRMRFVAKPRFKQLGPRLGGAMKAVAAAVATLPPDAVLDGYRQGELQVEADGQRFTLTRDELDFGAEAVGAYEVGMDGALCGALDITVDAALAREGHLRELVNRVQNLRKGAGLEVSDRIRLRWEGGELTRATLAEHGPSLMGETLAVDLSEGLSGEGAAERYTLGDEEVALELDKA
ncbi:isoleucine--tRNA ligase [bacterium]|nr:isoleucine--tRNA ligase [bacterium]